MSTAPQVQLTPTSQLPAVHRHEIRIISHCTLFYWWPVWAVGFLMAIITGFSGQRLAIVPHGTKLEKAEKIIFKEGSKTIEIENTPVLIPPESGKGKLGDPSLHIAGSKNLGVLFCSVLLLVIAITNIPLRGLWSVIVVVFLIFTTIIFAILGWWEIILERLSILDIRINLGGYLLISSVLFVLWLVVFIFFDRQIYMIFTPGQLRVRQEIGDAETAYDTTGMTIQKQRSDLFRHWVLGLGSGDLIVKTAGAQSHTFDKPNVLFIGRKVREIEDMLRSRQVISGQ